MIYSCAFLKLLLHQYKRKGHCNSGVVFIHNQMGTCFLQIRHVLSLVLATYNVQYVDVHWPLQQFYLTMSVEGDLHVQLLLGR